MARLSLARCADPRLAVEVRVEYPDLSYPIDRQVVASGGLADGLGRWCVVDGKGRALVLAHVRVHPRHTLLGIALDDRLTGVSTNIVDGDLEPIGKTALDD